jgi:hypothetical protein
MGEILVEAKEACVLGFITCTRICVFPEEEEENLMGLIPFFLIIFFVNPNWCF